MARSVGLAAYRIVQESLSNARRHAPGAAIRIVVDTGSDHLSLEIRNESSTGGSLLPGMSPEFGLIGMQERVELLDGEFRAGHQLNGGWRVLVRLPRQGRA